MQKKEQKKIFYRISEVQDEVFSIKRQTFEKGHSTGFRCLDELISYKQGWSTIIFSYAHQGKTQFVIEECVHLAKAHNVISAIYLTEAGNRGETILDIIQTYLGKNLSEHHVDDEDIFKALEWADKYFILLDNVDNLLSIRDIYSSVKEAEKQHDIKIGNLVIDHFGNLQRDEDQKFFNIADNVKYTLQAVTRTSKKFNLHTFILFHVRDTEPIKCGTTGKYYLPKPEMYAISGGQQSNFLGQQIISVWRPVMPYELNETHITVNKSKPKFIGKLGSAVIYFDTSAQKYYETIGGEKHYCGEYTTQHALPSAGIKPNRSFLEDDDIF